MVEDRNGSEVTKKHSSTAVKARMGSHRDRFVRQMKAIEWRLKTEDH
jgi:hypothetical protein